MKRAVLEVSQLTKTFPSREGEFVAVQDVSFTIAEGEFVSIMGHSGCGKSTVLNMVAGLLPVSKGAVLLDNRSVEEPGPDRMMVFQNYSLLPWLTALENVSFAIDSARSAFDDKPVFGSEDRARRKERAMKYLELVGLGEAIDKLPSELSGGMKQRVSIARALALEPRILLLDEPFGALDAITREEMQEELLDIWAKSKSTGLMITHEIDEAILLSDRIIMMTNGPAATIGTIFDVPLERPRTRQTLSETPAYYKLRNAIMKFLYAGFGEEEKPAATGEATTKAEAAE